MTEETEKTCETCRWGPYVDSKTCILCTRSRTPKTDRRTPNKEMRARDEMKIREERDASKEKERREMEAIFQPDEDSRTRREQIYAIRYFIKNLSRERPRGASWESLFSLALKDNIPEDRLKELLKRLADAGEVYSIQPGYFSLAEDY
jgi:DNA replicative helicase MCM subunit Mcm2 (Cdc46/Mcm family)